MDNGLPAPPAPTALTLAAIATLPSPPPDWGGGGGTSSSILWTVCDFVNKGTIINKGNEWSWLPLFSEMMAE